MKRKFDEVIRFKFNRNMNIAELHEKMRKIGLSVPAEDIEEYELTEEEQYMVYRYQYLTNKKEVLKCIVNASRKWQDATALHKVNSKDYNLFDALRRLCDKLYIEVVDSNLFDAPQGYWHYVIVENVRGISLMLVEEWGHVDGKSLEYRIDKNNDEYTLIHIPAKLLTIEEYAELYEVQAVTVRQWIRRGKIRTAVKAGSEWRIPELTEPPVKERGYRPACYTWNEIYEKVPEGFEYIHQYNQVDIWQDQMDKSKYNLWFKRLGISGRPEGDTKKVVCTVAEKEKLELFLIACSGVDYEGGMTYFFELDEH